MFLGVYKWMIRDGEFGEHKTVAASWMGKMLEVMSLGDGQIYRPGFRQRVKYSIFVNDMVSLFCLNSHPESYNSCIL